MAGSNADSSTKGATARAQAPAPWNKIARATGSPEPIASPASHPPLAPVIEPAVASTASVGEEGGGSGDSESVSASNGNVGKKPAWSSPSSGPETGAAMVAQSWPALTESVKGQAKPSLDSVKGLVDGLSSMSISQGTDAAPHQKQAAEQRHGNLNQGHPMSTRQRSMKRNGAASSGGVLTQAPLLTEQSADMQPRLSAGYHNTRGNFASQSHGSNDHLRQQRNSFKTRNGGINPRGDGFHHPNFGGRHDQERGNQEWTSNRSFSNNRDQQQRAIPGPIRPPPPPPIPYSPFLPSPIWPYSPIGFPEVAPPLYYVQAPPQDLRGVQFPLSPQPVYVPTIDPFLPSRILNQIEYYFSEQNLIKDTFLRQKMDDQGWVPISLIAGFKKVSNLTDNKNLILDVLQPSAVVEVQGDKVRKRNDWMRWIMPSPFQVSSSTTPQAL